MIYLVKRLLGIHKCDICGHHYRPSSQDHFRKGFCRTKKLPEREKRMQKALGLVVDICSDCVLDHANHSICGIDHQLDELELTNWSIWK